MASDKREERFSGVCHARVTRRAILQGAGAVGLAAVFAGRGAYAAEERPIGYRKLRITAKDYAFELPGSVPCGYTEIALHNKGSEEHHAMFMRLNPGKTTAEFMRAAKDEDFAALYAMSSSAGGPGSVSPGQASAVIVDLTPGEYVVICIVPDAQGMPHYKMGMLAPLTVTGTAKAERSPTADLTIDMIDFSFDKLPRRVRGSKHLWKVVDTSAQLHEMVLSRLAPGVSFDRARTMLMTPPPAGAAAASPAAASAVPFVAVAGVAPMSPGAMNWAVLDLEDGDYFAVCFVPDAKTRKPHFELGMIAPFTVKS